MNATKVPILLTLVAGVLIGYVVAQSGGETIGPADTSAAEYSPRQAATSKSSKETKTRAKIEAASLDDAVAQAPAASTIATATASVGANGKKPNIVFIMGDDVGWFNIGAYHQLPSLSAPRGALAFSTVP